MDDELSQVVVKIHVLVDVTEPDWRQAAYEQAQDIMRGNDPDNVVIEKDY